MPTGNYGTGSSSSAIYVGSISTLLDRLPDNTQNLIQPQDIRDPLWTIWNRVDDLSASFSAATYATAFYERADPMLIEVGGASAGTVFTGTVQDALDEVLYPYIAPVLTLTIDDEVKEFGELNTTIIHWSIEEKSETVISTIINGVLMSPILAGLTGASVPQDTDTTYNMYVSDGITTSTASVTVTWMSKRYWGTYASYSVPSDSEILGLTGAGVDTGNELSSTRVQNRDGISGSGNYLMFAWPTSFGEPTFIVNGMVTTAWTKIRDNSVFDNGTIGGYTASYDVWISNSAFNSPIATFQIN